MEYIAWPIATLIFGVFCVLLFRKSIRILLDRTRKIDKTGLTLIQEPQGPTAPEKSEDIQKITTPENREDIQKVIDGIETNNLVKFRENEIWKGMDEKKLSAEDRARLLLRLFANYEFRLVCEEISASIFGSQLGLLVDLNARTDGLSESLVAEAYRQARKTWPDVYSHYSLEQWTGYLLTSNLVKKENNPPVYFIMPFGREFLTYLVKAGKTYRRNH
jgi:hypothetical protein